MSEGERTPGNGRLLPPPPAGPVRAELARAMPDDPAFLERVMRYLEDDLSKQEVLALGRQLATDPHKRDTFVRLSLSDAISNSELASGGIVLPGAEAGPIDLDDPSLLVVRGAMSLPARRVQALASRLITLPAGAPPARSPRRRWLWNGLACIGALLAIACGLFALRLRPAAPLSQAPMPATAPAIRAASAPAASPSPGTLLVATLADGHRLRWRGPPVDIGSRLSNDIPLHVLDGLALVTLPNGTRIILQGTCDLAVHDTSSAVLYSGRLTAKVPPQVPFAVSAGKVSVASTGGAFGMTVAGDGVTEAHVLDGSLTATTNEGGAPLPLGTGLAVRGQTSGGSLLTLVASPAEFVTTWPAAPDAAGLPSVITRKEGDGYFDTNDFRNALVVYRELLRRDPSQLPQLADRLGTLYAWSGDFEAAASLFERAAAPAHSDIFFLYKAGCLRAVIGNGKRYRDDCRLMLSRYRGSTQRSSLERTAKMCLLYPASVDDMSAVNDMASRAPVGAKNDQDLRWYLLTAAFSEYRQGHDKAALDLLHQIDGKFSYVDRCSLTLLEAACEFRMKAPTVVAILAQARGDLAIVGPISYPNDAVQDWCVYKVLEAEVRALVGPAMWAAAAPPPPPDPIAAYNFDDSARAVVADSGQAPPANGTVHGSVSRIVGPAGIAYAMEFNGRDSWVEFGNPPKLNFNGTISMTAWVRCDDLSGEFRSILEHGPVAGPAGTETGLRIRRGAYEAGSWSRNWGYGANSPARDTGIWTFIAGTYDGKYWRLYRDGALVAESAAPDGAVKAAGNWFIGACADQNSRRAFKGDIAAVRVFNVALTGDQIAVLGKLGRGR